MPPSEVTISFRLEVCFFGISVVALLLDHFVQQFYGNKTTAQLTNYKVKKVISSPFMYACVYKCIFEHECKIQSFFSYVTLARQAEV